METSKNKIFAILTFLAALGLQVLTWFVLYPLAGYNDTTLLAAQLATLALGVVLVFLFPVQRGQLGVGARDFIRGVLGIAISYAVLLLVVVITNALGSEVPVFRQQYQLYAFANNWLLTGFGEELLFAGVLFNLLVRLFKDKQKWIAVLLTAASFALWHLPGYLAVGLKMDTLNAGLAFDLLLNMISWGFFGTIYLLSGNLWFTSFAHASTDYALLPAIVNSPLLGLVFMFFNVVIARWLRGPATTDEANTPGTSAPSLPGAQP